MRCVNSLLSHSLSHALLLLISLQLMAPVCAQLTVLSKGNPSQPWQKTQLALIADQLADKTIQGELRLELESQHQWLNAYQPGKLTEEPIVKVAGKQHEPLIDPILDPDGKAAAIRQKLLGSKARPSGRDTERLKLALQEFPEDVGLRQLQLHWLDQPQYRADYAKEIVDAAARFHGLVENLKLQPAKKKAVQAFALYRQARALGYCQDPDVMLKKPLTAEELKDVQGRLVGVYEQLVDLVGTGHPEFILLEIRMLRRDNWFGRALTLLELHEAEIEPRWYLEKRRDLLRDLGWKPAADEAEQLFLTAFPEEAAKK